MEAPLFEAIPSGPTFWEGGVAVTTDLYERGDKVGATDAFLTGVVGAEYRQIIAKSLPPGAFELAVADLDTFFQVELPALHQWRFTAEDAARIRQPVLAVVGTETAPIFSEGHAVLKQWILQTEELVVPRATHGLQMMNPRAVADGLARSSPVTGCKGPGCQGEGSGVQDRQHPPGTTKRKSSSRWKNTLVVAQKENHHVSNVRNYYGLARDFGHAG